MIIEIPNAIEPSKVNAIRDAVRPYINSSSLYSVYRNGRTVNISKTQELKETDNYLHSLFCSVQENVVKQRYNPSIPSSGDSGYEYHIYDPGDICNYHGDGEFSTNDKETFIRYASVILHLSTINNGGELVFPHQNKKVKTEAGKIVIFPPYGMFGHYTTPSDEPREVVVTWFLYDGVMAVRNN